MDTVYKSVQIDLRRCGRKPLPQRQCTVEGCNGRAYRDNLYCQKCTRRYQRHGDPTVVCTRGRKCKKPNIPELMP